MTDVLATPKTIYHSPGGKPFAWSYSRLKNYETCGKRYFEVDVSKRVKDDESEDIRWGKLVHNAAKNRLANGTTLPAGMEMLEPWCASLLTTSGKILVEQQLAITKDFAPCEWFANNTWLRVVCDVVKLNGRVGLVVDWKTGKILEDSVQLALAAACVFAHHPEVEYIRSEFIWLKDNASTPAYFKRSDMPAMWRSIWPRIEALEHAHKTTTFLAVPGRLCAKYCPVTTCVHHGRRN